MKKTILSLLFILVFISMAQADLVSYWKLDEGTGANLTDSTINEFTAVTTGGVTWADGISGKALKFDGSSGMVKFPTEMSLSGSSYSVSLWFNSTLNGNGVLVQQRNGGYNGQFQVRLDAGKIAIWTWRDGDGFKFSAGSGFNDGQWHHLLVTAEAGVGKIYVDGQFVGSGSGGVKILNSAIQFGMGADIRDNNTYYDGLIDEFMVFNHALTPEDVVKVSWPSNATIVAPADGETPVSIEPTLQWNSPYLVTPTGYDVSVGTDPNILTPVFTASNIDTLSVATTTLDYNTLYYWRVDVRDGATVIPGNPWSFTTVGAEPYVKVQPFPTVSFEGETATLSTLIYNAVDWKWYNAAETETVVGTEATLAIENMDMAKEGFYYCVAENSEGASVTTNSVGVRVARQIALWGFENDLTDSIAEWDGVYTDPNDLDEITPEPVFAEGISGQAIQVTGDGSFVDIPGSESFFNFYDAGLTVSLWVNPDAHVNTGGWYSIIRKHGSNGWSLADKQVTYGGGLVFNLPNVKIETSGRTDTGKWQLYTYTYDAVSDELKLYRDGVLASQSSGSFLGGSSGTIRIGGTDSNPGNNFRGLLDEVQVWNYPLDKYEVAHLFTDITGTSMCVDSVTGLDYDLNEDCIVNLVDFAMLIESWMDCNLVPTCYP